MGRECISFLRKGKQIEFSTDEIEVYDHPTDYANSELDASEIQQLIDGLPEGYKMVFVMYAIEGYKHQEIAEMLKISEGTSKSQLSHARKLLQNQINQLTAAENGTK